MDDGEMNDFSQKTTKFMKNKQTGPISGGVAPPMPRSSVATSPSFSFVPNVPNISAADAISAANAAAAAPAANAATVSQNTLPKTVKRVPMPLQYSVSPGATYGQAYNNYPCRSYMNMGGYNHYSSLGQPTINQYQNPVIIAAAENSRPAFESIQSVVQSFNAVSMMLESTFTAMHMSFQAILGVAENFTRLRAFMMKLYSTIVSFKLARWFLTKLFYLLRLVRGDRGSNVEEDLWTALSSTAQGGSESVPSDGRSWPLVVFTGLLVATPYFVYKLLNSVTPASTDNSNEKRLMVRVPGCNMIFKATRNLNSMDSNTITVLKGYYYYTSQLKLAEAQKNNGWVFFFNKNGKGGYVPISIMTEIKNHADRTAVTPEIPNVLPVPSIIPDKIDPHSLVDSDESKNTVQ